MEAGGHYIKLNVEKYGGMLCAPWMDRPLSVAGRLVVREGKRLVTKLVKVDRDLLMIPNLAIHFNREVNDGYKYNPWAMTCSFTAEHRGRFGELTASLSPAAAWTTCSVRLHP